MTNTDEERDYFSKKIEACMKIQEILRTTKGKEFLIDMEKAGYKNFTEVSMFTNFYEIFAYVNSLYENNNKLQGILKEHINGNSAVLDILKTLIEIVIELGENKNTLEKSLKEMSDKVQKMKIDLQRQVTENLKPIKDSFKEQIQEQKVDVEVAKMAKEREKWVDYIYG